MNDAIRMQLSAYVDGELPDNEAELLLRRVTQDAELRKEVAEYLAISRLARGEPGLAGADRLHERVAAELEDRPAAEMDAAVNAPKVRALRPLVGVAIAVSVALLAIFGLQQTSDVDDPASITGAPPLAGLSTQEQQRQYFLNHANASSRLGANGMNSRLVALQFSEEAVEQSDSDDPDEDEDAATETSQR